MTFPASYASLTAVSAKYSEGKFSHSFDFVKSSHILLVFDHRNTQPVFEHYNIFL